MKIGIIGCGSISHAYFKGAKNTNILEIKSCADIRMDAAKNAAKTYGCEAVTIEELFADTEIELAVNLTVPKAHVQVGISALESNKHVYSEKPLGVSTEEAYHALKVMTGFDKSSQTGKHINKASYLKH